MCVTAVLASLALTGCGAQQDWTRPGMMNDRDDQSWSMMQRDRDDQSWSMMDRDRDLQVVPRRHAVARWQASRACMMFQR
jgi:hypothetical protein